MSQSHFSAQNNAVEKLWCKCHKQSTCTPITTINITPVTENLMLKASQDKCREISDSQSTYKSEFAQRQTYEYLKRKTVKTSRQPSSSSQRMKTTVTYMYSSEGSDPGRDWWLSHCILETYLQWLFSWKYQVSQKSSMSAPGGSLRSNNRYKAQARRHTFSHTIKYHSYKPLTSGEPDQTQEKLKDSIDAVLQLTITFLEWIPAHTGIMTNEMADQLAELGTEKSILYPVSHLFTTDAKTSTYNQKKAYFQSRTGL